MKVTATITKKDEHPRTLEFADFHELNLYLTRLAVENRCTRKVRYCRHKSAAEACMMMAKKGSDGLTPYECDVCRGWHIGHTPEDDPGSDDGDPWGEDGRV